MLLLRRLRLALLLSLLLPISLPLVLFLLLFLPFRFPPTFLFSYDSGSCASIMRVSRSCTGKTFCSCASWRPTRCWRKKRMREKGRGGEEEREGTKGGGKYAAASAAAPAAAAATATGDDVFSMSGFGIIYQRGIGCGRD